MEVGIQFPDDFGAVSEIEEREAAVYALVPWYKWCDLHWWERASIVAHYRTHLLIEAHISEAEYQASKPKK